MTKPQKPKRSKVIAEGAARIITKAMANTRAAKVLEATKRNEDKK